MDHAQLLPDSNVPILCQIKSRMRIHNRVKFHEYSFYGCQVMNVQMFSEQQKVPLLGFFGWFLGHNSRKSSHILCKITTVMHTVILRHICYGFWNGIENFKKISPKTNFLDLLGGFKTTPCHALKLAAKSSVK